MKLSFTHLFRAGALALLLCGGSLAAQNKHMTPVVAASGSLDAYGMKDIELDPEKTEGMKDIELDPEKGVFSTVGLITVSPNPVRSEALIFFTLIEEADVTINLYDMQGRRVETPVQAHMEGSRTYHMNFTASDLADGIYYLQLTTSAGKSLTSRITLMK